MRERGVAGPTRETARDAAFLGDGVKLASVAEHDLLAVCRWKTKQPRRIGQRLAGSRAFDYDQEKKREGQPSQGYGLAGNTKNKGQTHKQDEEMAIRLARGR